RYNLIKIEPDGGAMTFLWYPDFQTEKHPRLREATRINAAGKVKKMTWGGARTPIFHRKELILPVVERHKTAIPREGISRPIRHAVLRGLLTSGMSVLDYGSGRGDDAARLRRACLTVQAYDPHFAPGTPRPADFVNLGFVLNVIEDPDERRRVLHHAWKLARRVLVVSVLQGDPGNRSRYRDGTLSGTGTFQWFPTDAMLERWLGPLGGKLIRLDGGIYAVTRS
ncbi:MAG: DNA phosphorothioation-associated putative methyltransferase, partial [Actinobacteria bacterium]|nr:DNA phosphorothioation-associated putative methyltransferase [Actinomycetota bacterium]